MDTLLPFVLGSIKALALLLVATGVTLVLRRRTARVRAVVWGTAIAGCLVIPLVAPLLPSWTVSLPTALERFAPSPKTEIAVNVRLESTRLDPSTTTISLSDVSVGHAPASRLDIDWPMTIGALWAIGAAALAVRLGIGSWKVQRALRTAHRVEDPGWQWLLEDSLERSGCRREVRLLRSDAVEVPATVGIVRPTIVLPPSASTWLYDRRRAVLLHEAIHIARFDWPVRMIARLARTVYWFNPLIWWAVRRLDLEQELACDEEVLALGTGASDYACHLLGIARYAVPAPAPAIPALGMARRTHLEERIMTILRRTTHRRVGMAVLVPAAVLMAAMVPALAAVYPGVSEPRVASPELKQIMTQMQEVEARMEPHLANIESIEIDMEPKLEMLEQIEVTIDTSEIENIEEQMRPYLEQIEKIEIDMKPYRDQMVALEDQLQHIELHIEDGTLEDVERQIHEQIKSHMKQMEDIHIDMEPYMKQIQAIQEDMAELHEQMAEVHVNMEPIHVQMEKIHTDLEPLHEELAKIHLELEPLHEEIDTLHKRMEHALQGEVIAVLQAEVGSVIAPGTPLDEAAARIADDANVNIDEGTLTFHASKRRTREVLTDLLSEHRIGTQEAFDAAIDNAANALSPLVIVTD